VRSDGEKEEIKKIFLNAKNYRRSSIIVDKADNDYQSDLIDNKLSKTSLRDSAAGNHMRIYNPDPTIG
jgi:hypothetical protein